MQATNDEQGFRGGSKPETAKAIGSSWSSSTKAHIKHEEKERRWQRVEAKLGAAAGSAAVESAAAEAEAMRGLMGPDEMKQVTLEAPEMELEESCTSGVVLHQEPAASIAEEPQGQDVKLKEERKRKRRGED